MFRTASARLAHTVGSQTGSGRVQVALGWRGGEAGREEAGSGQAAGQRGGEERQAEPSQREDLASMEECCGGGCIAVVASVAVGVEVVVGGGAAMAVVRGPGPGLGRTGGRGGREGKWRRDARDGRRWRRGERRGEGPGRQRAQRSETAQRRACCSSQTAKFKAKTVSQLKLSNFKMPRAG